MRDRRFPSEFIYAFPFIFLDVLSGKKRITTLVVTILMVVPLFLGMTAGVAIHPQLALVGSHVMTNCALVSTCESAGIQIYSYSTTAVLISELNNAVPTSVVWTTPTAHGSFHSYDVNYGVQSGSTIVETIIYHLDNMSASSNLRIWVNFSAAQTYTIGVVSLNGTASISLDSTGSNFGGSTSTQASATLTASQTNDQVLMLVSTVGASTMTATSGETLLNTSSPAATIQSGTFSETDTSSGSFTMYANFAVATAWAASVISFKSASVPSAPTSLTLGSVTSTTAALSWVQPKGPVVNDTIYEAIYSGACGAFSTVISTLGGTNAYTVSGLNSADSYCFYVTAWNTTGQSAASNELSDVTLPHVPPAPTGLTGSPIPQTTSSIDLAWTNPSGTVLNDTIYQGIGSGCNNFNGPAALSVGSVNTYAVSGLASGTTYCFAVTAWNATGQSAKATVVVTTNALPGPVTNLGETSATTTSISLAWTQPSGTIVNDTVYVSTTCGAWTTFSTGGPVSIYTVTGLAPFTRYCFQVQAWNAAGGSATPLLHNTLNATTLTTLPGSITNLVLTASTSTTLTYQWTNPPAIAGPLVNDSIYVGTTCSSFNVQHISIGSPSQNYQVSGLTAATTYCIAIAAWTQSGSGPLTEITSTTKNPIPGAPTHLSVVSASQTTITINWTNPSPVALIVNNTIYYGPGSSCTNLLSVVSAGVTQNYTVNGLTEATTYCFEVSAWSTGGQGANSAYLITGTQGVTPPAPYNLTAKAGQTWALVTWVNPAGFTLFNNTIYLNPNTCVHTGWARVISTNGVTTSWNVTGLTPSTTYCIVVTAWDNQSNFSSPLIFTTTGGGGLGPLPPSSTTLGTPLLIILLSLFGVAVLALIFSGRRRKRSRRYH